MDAADLSRSFRLWKRRVERSKDHEGPIVYFGTPSRKIAARALHLHLLLWEFLPIWFVRRHAEALGFGSPSITRIPSLEESYVDLGEMVQYVIGQQEQLFTSRPHLRHEPREHGKRSYWLPQNRTLARVKPELLSALDWAEHPDLPTDELLRRVPKFSNRYTARPEPSKPPKG